MLEGKDKAKSEALRAKSEALKAVTLAAPL
jgi:hypothetical protein